MNANQALVIAHKVYQVTPKVFTWEKISADIRRHGHEPRQVSISDEAAISSFTVVERVPLSLWLMQVTFYHEIEVENKSDPT